MVENITTHGRHVRVNLGKAQGFHTILGQNNGKAQIIEVIEEANTNGHYKATVKVLNPNPPPPYIIKQQNSGIPIENDMFADHWDANRLFEEVSYAFVNKIYSGKKNQWVGFMSDGNPCVICINNTAHIIDGTTEIKTAWPMITF